MGLNLQAMDLRDCFIQHPDGFVHHCANLLKTSAFSSMRIFAMAICRSSSELPVAVDFSNWVG